MITQSQCGRRASACAVFVCLVAAVLLYERGHRGHPAAPADVIQALAGNAEMQLHAGSSSRAPDPAFGQTHFKDAGPRAAPAESPAKKALVPSTSPPRERASVTTVTETNVGLGGQGATHREGPLFHLAAAGLADGAACARACAADGACFVFEWMPVGDCWFSLGKPPHPARPATGGAVIQTSLVMPPIDACPHKIY
jgi:hypothetical protein